jgi:hypothetical protein
MTYYETKVGSENFFMARFKAERRGKVMVFMTQLGEKNSSLWPVSGREF